jgi:hypothetical protein
MSHEGFLAWQRRLYDDGHRDRRNLLIHVLTQPLFVAGLAAAIAGPLTGRWWLLAAGPALMLVAIAAQGRGHRGEAVAPVPFRGPLDVIRRLVAEQLITFPRFVLSGGWLRAWRESRASSRRAA